MTNISFESISGDLPVDEECARIDTLCDVELEHEIECDFEDMRNDEVTELQKALILDIKTGLEAADESDTSLLKTFEKPLAAIGINTESNETALKDINGLTKLQPSNEELVSGFVGLVSLGVWLAMVLLGGALSIMLPIAIIYLLYKVGKALAENTEVQKSSSSTDDGKETSTEAMADKPKTDKTMKLMSASETQKQLKSMYAFCSFIESKYEKVKPEEMLKQVSNAQARGYKFENGKLTPKSVIVLKPQSISAAGWNGAKVESLRSELNKLGKLLLKYNDIAAKLKAKEVAAKEKAKKMSKEEKEKAKDKIDVEKVKEAASFAKQYSKAIARDAKKLLSMYKALQKQF